VRAETSNVLALAALCFLGPSPSPSPSAQGAGPLASCDGDARAGARDSVGVGCAERCGGRGVGGGLGGSFVEKGEVGGAWGERWGVASGGMDGCVCVWSILLAQQPRSGRGHSPGLGASLVLDARLKGHRGPLPTCLPPQITARMPLSTTHSPHAALHNSLPTCLPPQRTAHIPPSTTHCPHASLHNSMSTCLPPRLTAHMPPSTTECLSTPPPVHSYPPPQLAASRHAQVLKWRLVCVCDGR
jgi:hypothetical protein